MTAKIICLTQSKGGTSKTSSVWNISAALVGRGHRVLAVDVDQQANLTTSLGVDPLEVEASVYTLFTEAKVTAADIRLATVEGIDLLPANNDLAVVDFAIKEVVSREKILARKLRPITAEYDFIIIDTPPSFAITTLNAMSAAHYLVCPIQPEPYCLDGMRNLVRTYELIRQDANPGLEILGVFVTMYNSRLRAHREISEVIRNDWEEKAFKTVIRERTNILESVVDGRSIVNSRPGSDLAQDYQSLTEEILSRVR
jgi:chromosome partitioning protein